MMVYKNTNHHPEENTTDLGQAKVDTAVFDESLLPSSAGNIHDCYTSSFFFSYIRAIQ